MPAIANDKPLKTAFSGFCVFVVLGLVFGVADERREDLEVLDELIDL